MTTPLALRCTFFIDPKSNADYEKDKDLIHDMSEGVFFFPAVIGQAPINAGMALECVIIDRSELDAKVHLRSVSGHPYIVLEKNNNKKLYASGLCGSFGESIKEQSQSAFELAENILQEEGLEFSDIIRQWNYIENITQTVQQDSETFQHYQIFNDVRSLFYNKAAFSKGYPAATGSGWIRVVLCWRSLQQRVKALRSFQLIIPNRSLRIVTPNRFLLVKK